MADIAFADALGRIGFNARARELLAQQGFSTLADLCNLAVGEVDPLMKHLASWKATGAVVAGVEGQAQALPPVFPFLSIRKLKALRLWAQYKIERGQEAIATEFVDAVIVKWTNHLVELHDEQEAEADDDNKPPGELKSFDKWVSWLEAWTTYLSRIRSKATLVPMTYLIRDHEEVTEEQLAETYDSIDEEMIATMKFSGTHWKTDNKRLYDLLKPLIVDGGAWPFIQTYNQSKNGRKAFMALKKQAEGQAATTTRKAKAYASIATARYTGKGKFTYDQYVARHQRAHNELLALGEEVAGTKKVSDFLDGISDPRLNTGMDIVDGNTLYQTDFEECQQFFKTLIEHRKTRHGNADPDARGPDRRIAKLESQLKGMKGGSGKKKMHTPTKGKAKIHSGHYTSAEYRALTDDEKDRVRALRDSVKKRKAAAITTTDDEADDGDDGDDAGSAKVASAKKGDDDAEKKPAAKNAGEQFGRSAHKKTVKVATPKN
jgi:hypothetical protein